MTDSAGNVVYSEPGTIQMAKVRWEYTYDADGMRTGRTDGYNNYRYVYNGGSLSYMELRGSIKFYFSYDASGTPVSVKFGTGTYYYVTNLQGDVTAILNGSGEAVVEYIYDAWGNLRDTTGSMAGTLGYYNPLRYRGYVYDPETGLYYLQSRYYDPKLGRFLNADILISTGQGLLGNNMFSYCRNSPFNRIDKDGMRDEEASEEKGENTENMMVFFGADSAEDLPVLPDNCMVFIENIWSFTVAGVTYVHGTTIVMDEDKYCMYSFNGLSYGCSGIPYDYCETVGYVYNVENVHDFCGFFYGGSFNEVYRISGGAYATNGVYSEIISGTGFGSSSIGISVTYYGTPYNDWKYGKANISWHQTPYGNPNNPFSPWNYEMSPHV